MRALAAATTPTNEGAAAPVSGVMSPTVMVVGVTPEDDLPDGADEPADVGDAEELPEELQADTNRAAVAITTPTVTNERLVLKTKLLS